MGTEGEQIRSSSSSELHVRATMMDLTRTLKAFDLKSLIKDMY